MAPKKKRKMRPGYVIINHEDEEERTINYGLD